MPVITKTIREPKLLKLQIPLIGPRLLPGAPSKKHWGYLEILHPIDLIGLLEMPSRPRKKAGENKTNKRFKKRKR